MNAYDEAAELSRTWEALAEIAVRIGFIRNHAHFGQEHGEFLIMLMTARALMSGGKRTDTNV